jgi:tetratricopeptide (TPR) repeat protein
MLVHGINHFEIMEAHKIELNISRLNYRLSIGMVLAVLTVMALLIYFPGLSGPYVLDDEENISKNEAVAVKEISTTNLWHAMQSNDSGPFRRPLATLSFALNHYFSGGFGNTFPFKLTNLIIHIINGVLLLFLAQKIMRLPEPGRRLTSTEQFSVAALAAALWTMHPIQLTNVLYVVQRMNSLSALFVILGLIIFLEGRRQFADSTPKGLKLMAAGVLFGTLLGMSSKENAALLPLFALAIEYSFFRHESLTTRQRLLLRSFYIATAAVPLTAFLGYLYVNPEFLSEAYKVRHFSMGERLLTETRVLWHYMSLIALPSTHNLGLFHDDILISKGFFTPLTTFFAICGLIVLLLIAFIKRIPTTSFAILWFLAGHLLESSLFGLEIAYEHRNYLPAFGILFAASYFYVHISRHWNASLRFIIATTVVLALGFATLTSVHNWKDLYSIAETNVANHPDSPRANEFAARVNAMEKGDLVTAIRHSIQALKIAPEEAGFHINLHLLLAMLASQIEQGMKSVSMREARGADLQINGLPTGIIATINNNNIQLVYPPSTSNAVAELLKTKPITVHTLASLIGLSRCIVDKPELCQRLAKPGLKWYAIAADNPVTARAYNALILNNTAELYANTSEYTTALAYTNKATQAFPDVLFYRLKKIEYLIKLGHLDEAQLILSTIDAISPENDIRLIANRTTINAVREMYAKAARANVGHH